MRIKNPLSTQSKTERGWGLFETGPIKNLNYGPLIFLIMNCMWSRPSASTSFFFNCYICIRKASGQWQVNGCDTLNKNVAICLSSKSKQNLTRQKKYFEYWSRPKKNPQRILEQKLSYVYVLTRSIEFKGSVV